MKYAIRALKYLLFLCVLYVGLAWLMAISEGVTNIDIVALIEAQLTSERGVWLVVAFVVLAALYPSIGFMTSRVDNCDLERDKLRINNAMQLYGLKFIKEEGNVQYYRAAGPLRRIMLMFEDHITVRQIDKGVEIKGLRRSVARVAYQLKAYINNSRFEK